MLLSILFFGVLVVGQKEIVVNQGGVLLIPISANSNLNNLHAQLGTHKLPIVNRSDSQFVLVSADVEMKQGSYQLRLYTKGRVIDSNIVQVKKVSFLTKIYDKEYYQKKGVSTRWDTIAAMNWKRYLNTLSTYTSAEYAAISRLIDPLPNIFITSTFGKRRIYTDKKRQHKGVDLRASIGTEAFAVGDGKVIWAENDILPKNGITVVLDLGGGIRLFYLHLSKVLVKTGDKVKEGQVIGLSGAADNEPHLHFEVRCRHAKVDPMAFLQVFR